VDAELAREFGPAGKPPEAKQPPVRADAILAAERPPTRVLAPLSTATLVDTLAQQPLLKRSQLDEVTRTLKLQFPEPRGLAGELLKRGWLTAYQVNQLLQGRGPALVLDSYHSSAATRQQIANGVFVRHDGVEQDTIRRERTTPWPPLPPIIPSWSSTKSTSRASCPVLTA